MRKIILILILSFITIFAQAQNVAGDNLRIYKNAQIGEDGNATINMHSNRVQGVADPINLLDAVNLQYFINNMSLTQPLDSLSLTPLTESDIQTEYTMFADTLSYSGSFKTGLGNYVYKLGQATVLLYYNDNAYTIEPFDVLHLKSGALVNGQLYPTPELADASDWEKTQGTLSVAAHTIPPGSFGFTVIYGILKGGDATALTPGSQLWLTDDGSGDVSSSRPAFQSYAISIGGAFNNSAAPDGQIFVNITRDIYDTFNDGWDGAIRETFNFTTSSDGISTITGTLENVIDTKNLTLLFSDGFSTFDTTPAATLTLVAGTATVVQLNYVFIDKATKTLQTSAGGFPVTEHAKVALVGVFDAAATLSNGAIRNQNINDHIKKEDDNGHILHIAERLRQFNAEWDSGTETILSGTPTNVYFSNTSGNVYQLHLQTFPVQDMSIGDDIHVVNDPTTPYRTTTNLNDITEFSDGSSWNNEWSNVVVWGVCNKSGEISHLMVNLPSDGYNSEADAFSDAENATNYNIPKDFKGVGFLMGRFTIRRSGANFTYNLSTGYLDLRGFIPNNTAGTGGGGPSGITTLLALTDTPGSYIGFAKQALTVTDAETGTEFTPVVTTVNGGGPTLGDYTITSTANKVGEDVTIGTSGTGVDAVFSVADNDNNPDNENQDLSNSKLNNTVTVDISNGGSTTITDIARTAGFLNPVLNTSSLETGGVERINSTGDGNFRFIDGSGLATLKSGLIAGIGGVEKFRATSGGIDVTGNIEAVNGLFSGFIDLANGYPANANANFLRLGKTTVGNTGLSIISERTSNGSIYFSDNDASTAAFITYNHADDEFSFKIGSIEKANINALGILSPSFISTVTTGTQPYACASTTLNINQNSDLLDGQHGSHYLDYNNFTNTPNLGLYALLSGATFTGDVTVNGNIFGGGYLDLTNSYVPNAFADDLRIGGTTIGSKGMTIASDENYLGIIYFGDNNDNDAGSIAYDHTTDRLSFGTARIQRGYFDASGLTVFDVITGSNLSGTNTGNDAVNSLYSGLVSNVTTNLSVTHNSGNVFINSSDGDNATLNGANVANSGVMTATNQVFAGTKGFIDEVTIENNLLIENGIGRLDIKSTSLLALPVNTIRFLDANGVLAQEIQAGSGVDNTLRIINEKEGIELYYAGASAGDLKLSTVSGGIDVNGDVDADSYSIGGVEVIDASSNFDGGSGTFGGDITTTSTKIIIDNPSSTEVQFDMNSATSFYRFFYRDTDETFGIFDGTNTRLRCKPSGEIELMHLNSVKFETTSIGGTVTGSLTATVDVNCVDLNYSGALNNVSDQRVKDSIRDFEFNREAFKRLSVKRYNFKADSANIDYINPMAKDLEAQFPWLVNHSKTKIVRNDSIIAISTLSDIEKSNIKDEDRLLTIKSMQLAVMSIEGLRLEMIKNDSLQLIVDENRLQIEILKALYKNLDDRLKALEN
jgi:hypothetical protein